MKPAYKPVLCVVSSHPIKGASGVPTGFFLAELTHPLKVLEDANLVIKSVIHNVFLSNSRLIIKYSLKMLKSMTL